MPAEERAGLHDDGRAVDEPQRDLGGHALLRQ